jgi:hypothetical protein
MFTLSIFGSGIAVSAGVGLVAGIAKQIEFSAVGYSRGCSLGKQHEISKVYEEQHRRCTPCFALSS